MKTLHLKLTAVLIFSIVLFSTILAPQVYSVSKNTAVHFAATGSCNDDVQGIGSGVGKSLFVPWYKYLDCTDGSPDTSGMTIAEIGTKVLIAIIELLTKLAGLVAVGFVIYGSIQYITSQGEPEGIKNAKSTITNALIGFVFVVLAVAAVQFLGRAIG